MCSLYWEKQSSISTALLLSAITLDFSTYSYFRHFGLNHYGPKPSCFRVEQEVQVSKKCTCIITLKSIFLVERAAAASLLFHTPQSVETRNSQKLPCEKTNFRSWRKQDKLQIVSFKFNLNILVMFYFSSFMNYNILSLLCLSFAWCF